MSFTARYPEGREKEALVAFTQAEFYDLVYAAREAEIRFKRLRTKTWAEAESWHPDAVEARVADCNENIAHYKAMEKWLKEKYRDTFGEEW